MISTNTPNINKTRNNKFSFNQDKISNSSLIGPKFKNREITEKKKK